MPATVAFECQAVGVAQIGQVPTEFRVRLARGGDRRRGPAQGRAQCVRGVVALVAVQFQNTQQVLQACEFMLVVERLAESGPSGRRSEAQVVERSEMVVPVGQQHRPQAQVGAAVAVSGWARLDSGVDGGDRGVEVFPPSAGIEPVGERDGEVAEGAGRVDAEPARSLDRLFGCRDRSVGRRAVGSGLRGEAVGVGQRAPPHHKFRGVVPGRRDRGSPKFQQPVEVVGPAVRGEAGPHAAASCPSR
jgi:hypothetical protein